jgi:hypothetical protein
MFQTSSSNSSMREGAWSSPWATSMANWWSASVARCDMNIAQAQLGQGSPGRFGDFSFELDRVDFLRQPAEQRRLVAGARPNVEHTLVALELERLHHQRD